MESPFHFLHAPSSQQKAIHSRPCGYVRVYSVVSQCEKRKYVRQNQMKPEVHETLHFQLVSGLLRVKVKLELGIMIRKGDCWK